VVTQCDANTCTCSDAGTGASTGTPATGASCTSDGSNICARCNAHHYFNASSSTCTACPTASTLDEPGHTFATCVCDMGHVPTMTGGVVTACTPYTCTCSDAGTGAYAGTPATGASCTSDGTNICASCNANYYYNASSSTCTACPTGSSLDEPGHTFATCVCDMGHVPTMTGGVVTACTPYTCTCTDSGTGASTGTPAAGASCTSDGSNICASCNAHHYFDASSNSCTACPTGSTLDEPGHTFATCVCDMGHVPTMTSGVVTACTPYACNSPCATCVALASRTSDAHC